MIKALRRFCVYKLGYLSWSIIGKIIANQSFIMSLHLKCDIPLYKLKIGYFYHYLKTKIPCSQIFTISVSHASILEEFDRSYFCILLWCQFWYFRAWKGNSNNNYTRITGKIKGTPGKPKHVHYVNDFGSMYKKINSNWLKYSKSDLFSHVPEKPRDGMNYCAVWSRT